jgi:hypothetical protein
MAYKKPPTFNSPGDFNKAGRSLFNNPEVLSSIKTNSPQSQARSDWLNNAQAALNEVKKDWTALSSEQFNPVPLALDLTDGSSLGKDQHQFSNLLKKIHKTVEEVVNANYRQFNSTTTIFTGVQNELWSTKGTAQTIKSQLLQTKEILQTKRADLNGLWNKAKQYKEMLRILDKLDNLKKTPEKIEQLIRDKYYKMAIQLLLNTLEDLDSPELKPIEATSGLRRALLKIKNNLHNTLVEEIHNHVYMKIHLKEEFDNFGTLNNASKFQDTIVNYLINTNPFNNRENRRLSNSGNYNFISLEEDLSLDPEADSLKFISILVNGLYQIGKLNEGTDMIKTRAHVELYQLVDKTVDEVKAKLDKGQIEFVRQIPQVLEFGDRKNLYDKFFSDLQQSGKVVHNRGKPPVADVGAANQLHIKICHSKATFKENQGLLQPRGSLFASRSLIKLNTGETPAAGTPGCPTDFKINSPPGYPSDFIPVMNSRQNLLNLNSPAQLRKGRGRRGDFPFVKQNQLPATGNACIEFNGLSTFTTRLLQKFEFVFANHRFIQLLIKDIGVNQTDFDSRYSINEIWTSIQNEIQRFLHDYVLGADGNDFNINGIQDIMTHINESMKRGFSQRDHKKLIFKISDTRVKSNTQAKERSSFHEMQLSKQLVSDQLMDEIYSGVYGRVIRSAGPLAIEVYFSDSAKYKLQSSQLVSITVDQYSYNSFDSARRLLINPHVYNLSILIKPILDFVDKIQSIGNFEPGLLHQSPQSPNFLSKFISVQFLPKMELHAQYLLSSAIVTLNAFQVGHEYSPVHNKPLIRCVSDLLGLMRDLCTIFRSLPFNRKEFLPILEFVITSFLDKSTQFFKSLVSVGSNSEDQDTHKMLNSAQWAQSPELYNILTAYSYIKSPHMPPNSEEEELFNNQEMATELSLKQRRSLHLSELLFDTKKLSLLASLAHSLKCFSLEVNSLLKDSKEKNTLNDTKDNYTVNLDNLLKGVKSLSDKCLFTLRVEFRCHCMYFLDLALREGDYYLTADNEIEPDDYILKLNIDLTTSQGLLSQYLEEKDVEFIFQYLSKLLSAMLIMNVRDIRVMSDLGLKKMRLNLSSLQQNLTNLKLNNNLNSAKLFYDLYDLQLNRFYTKVQEQGIWYSYSEYKSLLDLALKTSDHICQIERETTKSQSSADQRYDEAVGHYSDQMMALRALLHGSDD